MKKLFYLFTALVLGFGAAAQNEQEPTDSEKRLDTFTDAKRHELSLDVGAALVIPAIQPRYEYVLGRYSGIGVDLFFDLSDDEADYSDIEKFSITPFYRQYFFSKEDYGAKGFYAEGFLKAYTFDETYYDYNSFTVESGTEDSYFETAIGVGIGWKWVSNSGFMIDVGVGIGRNLGFADIPDYWRPEVVPRGGVHFGWRF
jgi:hypothetical protein